MRPRASRFRATFSTSSFQVGAGFVANGFRCNLFGFATTGRGRQVVVISLEAAASSWASSNPMADKDSVLVFSKTVTSFSGSCLHGRCLRHYQLTRLSSIRSFRKANRNACSNWSRMSYASGEQVIHSFCASCLE